MKLFKKKTATEAKAITVEELMNLFFKARLGALKGVISKSEKPKGLFKKTKNDDIEIDECTLKLKTDDDGTYYVVIKTKEHKYTVRMLED